MENVAALTNGSGCRTPEEKHASFMESGKSYFENGDYARAILEFKNAARSLPGAADPRYYLGLSYLEIGSITEAVVALKAATDLDPTYAEAQLILAQLMLSARNPELLQEAESRDRSSLVALPAAHRGREAAGSVLTPPAHGGDEAAGGVAAPAAHRGDFSAGGVDLPAAH